MLPTAVLLRAAGFIQLLDEGTRLGKKARFFPPSVASTLASTELLLGRSSA